MKKKKNAFTLIELLAIIVILAIIAVITVPIILNIIENSRKGAAQDSAYGYKDAVSKYYVTELANNRNFQLEGTYTVSDGKLDNIEVLVSGTKPTSGELHYSNNVLQGGCLIFGDYEVIFTGSNVTNTQRGDCSNYEYDDGTLKIGDTVNYSTSLNGVTLDNWKVFYVDGDYTYLILSDYLPNVAVDTTNIEGLGTNGTYGIYANNNGNELLNAMITKSNWDSLLIGTLNETIAINEESSENIWAIGAPTLDLWVDSWNTSFNSDLLYTNVLETNGVVYYQLGTSNDDFSSPNIVVSSKPGYDNTLYFPHKARIEETSGTWFASPTSSSANTFWSVDCFGSISQYFDYKSTAYGNYSGLSFRPVIKLPTSVVNQ